MSGIAAEETRPGPALVLVGPNQQENLGLQYLAACAERAGFSTQLVGFNSRDDLGRAVAHIKRSAPVLVGLGMSFQHSVGDYLELAQTLRDQGYRGHLTAGGHAATFCWSELLANCPALDSIVRHEGEVAIVELLQRLTRGESAAGLTSLAWREAGEPTLGPERQATIDLDLLPSPKRSQTPYLVAGIPIAFLLTARGCMGECAYCSVGAYAMVGGGPRYRLRSPEKVAAELAELAERGVRIAFVQDDLFVLPSETRAVDRMAALAHACEVRGVQGLAYWAKARPDSITPTVLRAAKRLGIIHLFLGVENAVRERLVYLGRHHLPEHNQRALALCRDAGLHASFNLMLFDPESRLDEVSATVDFAAEHLDLPWNLCRTEIYPGTPLFQRLQAAGRLTGDFQGWGYCISDPRAELAFRVLRVCLHERAFASDSLHNKLISLAFAVQSHQWLFPGGESEALAAQANSLARAVRADTVAILRRVLDFARRANPEDRKTVHALAIAEGLTAGQHDLAYHARVERQWDMMQARGQVLLGSARRSPAASCRADRD